MRKRAIPSIIMASLVITLLITACSRISPEVLPDFLVPKGAAPTAALPMTDEPSLQSSVSPTITPVVSTATPLIITATLPPSPTATATETALPTPTATVSTNTPLPSATPVTDTLILKIYLVAIGDNGASGTKIGCEDSLVAVDVGVSPTVAVLRSALTKLLEIKTSSYGDSGLYNSLYQSDLSIDDLSILNGVATIHLSGDLLLAGVCDHPRVEEQLRAVALQFSTVSDVKIFVNDKPLDEVLSLR